MEMEVKEQAVVGEIKNEEFACIRAGIGGGLQNTRELQAMDYDEAVSTKHKEKWEISVEEEYKKMKKYNVWNPIKLRDFQTRPIFRHPPRL